MSKPRTVGVVGATGYAGAELVRLLLGHPELHLSAVGSRSQSGRALSEVHPALSGFTDLVFEVGDAERLSELDTVFLAVPHGTAREWALALGQAGTQQIIDLSADHRHADGWIYGQAEWHREQLPGARRVAVPGCFATAISLALAPFVASDTIEGTVQCVAATGSTGAGATPKTATHHPERLVNLKGYKVLNHQHTPEIQTFLGGLGSFDQLQFVPLSAPVDRGILATCFLHPKQPDTFDGEAILQAAYADHPAVRVRTQSPEIRHVRGTVLCDISVHQEDGQVAVLSAIDNLGKGAAAQAVQCLNLSLDWPVSLGLEQIPCLP